MIWKTNDSKNNSVAQLLVMVFILTLALYFSKSTITGNMALEITRHPVNIVVDKSASFIFMRENSFPFELHSLSVSGEVLGEGRARIYISDGNGIRRLVYSNEHSSIKSSAVSNEISSSIDFCVSECKRQVCYNFCPSANINRKSLASVSDSKTVLTEYRDIVSEFENTNNVKTLEGSFRRACSETCELDSTVFNNARYELLIYVDAGTSVHLSEVLYT